jgi:hypothetical protein
MSTMGICHFISIIVPNDKLTSLRFSFNASTCADVQYSWWRDAGLAAPPQGVVRQGWTAVLSFLRLPAKVSAFRAQLSRALHLSTVVSSTTDHKLLAFSSFAQLPHAMSLVLSAAAACPIFGPRTARAHYLQPPVPLGILPSQRSLELASLQLWCHDKERQRLFCCGCLLSTLALRLAHVAVHEGGHHMERRVVIRIMKRCLSIVAWRFWQEPELHYCAYYKTEGDSVYDDTSDDDVDDDADDDDDDRDDDEDDDDEDEDDEDDDDDDEDDDEDDGDEDVEDGDDDDDEDADVIQ